MESSPNVGSALTGWTNVEVSDDGGENWYRGSLRLSVDLRTSAHIVNGFYTESFGSLSERALWTRHAHSDRRYLPH